MLFPWTKKIENECCHCLWSAMGGHGSCYVCNGPVICSMFVHTQCKSCELISLYCILIGCYGNETKRFKDYLLFFALWRHYIIKFTWQFVTWPSFCPRLWNFINQITPKMDSPPSKTPKKDILNDILCHWDQKLKFVWNPLKVSSVLTFAMQISHGSFKQP